MSRTQNSWRPAFKNYAGKDMSFVDFFFLGIKWLTLPCAMNPDECLQSYYTSWVGYQPGFLNFLTYYPYHHYLTLP